MSINRRFIFRVFVSFFAVALIYVFLGSDTATQNAQEQPEKNTFRKFETPDAVTRVIRDKTKNFAIIKINSESERDEVYKRGDVLEDYGSFVLTASDKSQILADLDLDSQTLDTTINLPNGAFEPITEQPSQAIGTDLQKNDTSGKNYYIVQFGSIAKDEWLESLREIGAEVVQYVPHQAFIVYADGAAINKINGHSRVRWVGKYAAEQKISPELNDFTARLKNETAMFDIAVFARADLDTISAEFTNITNGQIKSRIKLSTNFFNILRVEVSTSELSKIAEIPDVFRIDPYTKPVNEDERAAQIVAGNFVSSTELLPPGYDPLSQFGVDGSNVTVAVVDDGISISQEGGFYINSTNAADGPLRGAALGATGGHGHFNASIIAGSTPFSALDPLGYNYGMGIAPKANVTNIPFTKAGYTGDDVQAIDDALNTEGPNGVKGSIANNSWGNGANGNSYDAFASMYDGFVRDASRLAASFDPITLIFSAGNCGNVPQGPACSNQNGLTRPKVAKNIITVGNSENIRPEISTSANNLNDLASSSSRGPAADGRVKPDITAPGTIITGSRAGNGGLLDGGPIDANHYYSSGTSHSAPQVAGAAALFTHLWKNTHGGANPSPAMIKAAIISSAQEMNGANAAGAIPNGNEGWGRINLKNMLNTGVPMKYVDQETVFAVAGENSIIEGTVGSSSKPVRVSLVWTDPPAVADPALVNNLDLTVTIGNNIYKGNVFGGGSSVTGGSADTVNNVENVFLPAGIPAGTPFKIEVTAKSINADGRVGNADSTDQHFALIAYNYSSCTYSLSSAFQNVPASGGNITVDLTTPSYCSWTTSSNVSWAIITSGSSNAGNGVVVLSVQPNNGGFRTGTVKIAGRDFIIEQQGSSTACSYTLSPTSVSIASANTNSSFSITTQTGCSWTAASNSSWISLTSSSNGSGNGTITFTAQANTSTARSGTITVGGQTFTVNQASGCSYSLSSNSASFSETGGNGSVNVNSDLGCVWTAVSNVSWITVTNGSNGTGNGTVAFTVAASNGQPRSGTITVAGQTFTVTQAQGCSYSVPPNGANLSSGGATASFNVNAGAGCQWTATSNASWITITAGSSGSGNGVVTFSVTPNTGAARTGTITVANQTFTVNQAAACIYTLSSVSINVPANGLSGSVTVTANTGCAWTAQSNVPWITVTSNPAGNGNGTVAFTVAANTGTDRTGTITIAGQTFTVNQTNNCTYTISPTNGNFSGVVAASSFFSITTSSSGCSWTAVSNSSWITINNGTGTGNGTVTFSISANLSMTARTGTITVAGQTFTVNQAAGVACNCTVPKPIFDFDGDGKTDLSIFRPAVGEWWYLKSSHVGNSTFQFGSSTDKLVPADYTGDGKTDIAFFRPSTSEWFILRSEDNSFFSFPFGAGGDVPAPADYDGDGKSDPAVFRPSSTTWFISLSSGGTSIRQFGVNGDVPTVADYDGDGKSDIAIYRPSSGQWWLQRSAAGTIAFQFGASADKPVQGDYTGDGKTDVAFYRPSSGEWFVLRSEDNSYYSAPFGSTGDIASPGDYDGDGKSDFAVFRPSSNTWFVQRSGAGTLIQTFGISGDKPVPAAFIP
jgi:hypothetical protein